MRRRCVWWKVVRGLMEYRWYREYGFIRVMKGNAAFIHDTYRFAVKRAPRTFRGCVLNLAILIAGEP